MVKTYLVSGVNGRGWAHVQCRSLYSDFCGLNSMMRKVASHTHTVLGYGCFSCLWPLLAHSHLQTRVFTPHSSVTTWYISSIISTYAYIKYNLCLWLANVVETLTDTKTECKGDINLDISKKITTQKYSELYMDKNRNSKREIKMAAWEELLKNQSVLEIKTN